MNDALTGEQAYGFVYHHIDGPSITEALAKAGYSLIDTMDYPLPNGKKLQRLDYKKELMKKEV